MTDQYVYIRYNLKTRKLMDKWFGNNSSWDKLIECLGKKYFKEFTIVPTKKVKYLIMKEANELLTEKLSEYGDSNNYIFKTKISITQISKLRNPKNGYTTCHAGIILMAIFNLLYDECDCQHLGNLKSDLDKNGSGVNYQTYALRDQYTKIKEAYSGGGFGGGDGGGVSDHQKQLIEFYLGCTEAISDHNMNHDFSKVITHFATYGRFSRRHIVNLKAYLR